MITYCPVHWLPCEYHSIWLVTVCSRRSFVERSTLNNYIFRLHHSILLTPFLPSRFLTSLIGLNQISHIDIRSTEALQVQSLATVETINCLYAAVADVYSIAKHIYRREVRIDIPITYSLQMVRKLGRFVYVLDWWKREMRRVIAPQDLNPSISARWCMSIQPGSDHCSKVQRKPITYAPC